MVWEKGQVRTGAGGKPMPDPIIEVKEEEVKKSVVSKKNTSSKSKKT